MTKLLHVADFHANAAQYAWLVANACRYDAIAMAGDLLDIRQFFRLHGQIKQVGEFIRQLPGGMPVLICSGNHDSDVDHALTEKAKWLFTLRDQIGSNGPRLFLDGDTITLDNQQIAIAPWGGVPDDRADISLVHWPAASTSTSTSIHGDYGDPAVRDYLSQQGGIQLCGHVHQAFAWHYQKRAFYDLVVGFHVFNPCNHPGRDTPNYIVFDLEAKTATRELETVSYG